MAPRILVVDDELDVLRIVSVRLRSAGYDVTLAETGQAAFAALEAQLPDLILLDLRLPGMDGFEICRRIKDHPVWKKIPIILFTASAHVAADSQYKTLGAEDFVTKPFEWGELSKKVKALLPAASGGG